MYYASLTYTRYCSSNPQMFGQELKPVIHPVTTSLLSM